MFHTFVHARATCFLSELPRLLSAPTHTGEWGKVPLHGDTGLDPGGGPQPGRRQQRTRAPPARPAPGAAGEIAARPVAQQVRKDVGVRTCKSSAVATRFVEKFSFHVRGAHLFLSNRGRHPPPGVPWAWVGLGQLRAGRPSVRGRACGAHAQQAAELSGLFLLLGDTAAPSVLHLKKSLQGSGGGGQPGATPQLAQLKPASGNWGWGSRSPGAMDSPLPSPERKAHGKVMRRKGKGSPQTPEPGRRRSGEPETARAGRPRGAGPTGAPPRPRRNLAPSGGSAGAPIAAAPPARPPPRTPTSRPAAAQPRAGSRSRRRRRVRGWGWGRGRPGPTGPENKAAAAAARTFSAPAPRSRGDYLPSRARPPGRNSAPARPPALGSRTRRQRGFTRPAGSRPPQAPLPPPPPAYPLPVPSGGPRAGGPGARGGGARPARGLSGAVVSASAGGRRPRVGGAHGPHPARGRRDPGSFGLAPPSPPPRRLRERGQRGAPGVPGGSATRGMPGVAARRLFSPAVRPGGGDGGGEGGGCGGGAEPERLPPEPSSRAPPPRPGLPAGRLAEPRARGTRRTPRSPRPRRRLRRLLPRVSVPPRPPFGSARPGAADPLPLGGDGGRRAR